MTNILYPVYISRVKLIQLKQFETWRILRDIAGHPNGANEKGKEISKESESESTRSYYVTRYHNAVHGVTSIRRRRAAVTCKYVRSMYDRAYMRDYIRNDVPHLCSPV